MHRPGTVAQVLAISPATLRQWSNEFSDFLSESARQTLTEGPGHAQRRYTADDIAILRRAKSLLASGLTYAETRERLAQPPAPAAASADASEPPAPEEPPASEVEPQSLAITPEVRALIVTLRRESEARAEHVETLKDQLSKAEARAQRAEVELSDLRRALLDQLLTPPAQPPQRGLWERIRAFLFGDK